MDKILDSYIQEETEYLNSLISFKKIQMIIKNFNNNNNKKEQAHISSLVNHSKALKKTYCQFLSGFFRKLKKQNSPKQFL